MTIIGHTSLGTTDLDRWKQSLVESVQADLGFDAPDSSCIAVASTLDQLIYLIKDQQWTEISAQRLIAIFHDVIDAVLYEVDEKPAHIVTTII